MLWGSGCGLRGLLAVWPRADPQTSAPHDKASEMESRLTWQRPRESTLTLHLCSHVAALLRTGQERTMGHMARSDGVAGEPEHWGQCGD